MNLTRSEKIRRLKLWREKQRRISRGSLIDFVTFTKEDYLVNWHHTALCDELDQFMDPKSEYDNIIVEMPPQHGKSEIVSRRFPAYCLGQNPKYKIIGISYSADLAQSFNRDVKRIIDDPVYREVFPDTFLNRTNVKTDAKGSYLKNAEIFETVGHGGFYNSVGITGSITGKSADIIIIDDPIKGSEEANSPTYREKVWQSYLNDISTRGHNGTKKIVMMTRWHEDDLIGRIKKNMKKTGEKWKIVSFPAILDSPGGPQDPRQIGEALWEEMHSKEKLERMRIASPRTFGSLYQQDPRPIKTGGEFYKSFDQEANTGVFFYNKDLPLHVSFDFNVLPYVTINVYQITGDRDKGFKVRQVDEIAGAPPHNYTAGACRLFLAKYRAHWPGLYIYGDPSGKHQDTRSEQGWNDYDIIYQELKEMNPIMRVGSSAAPVILRGVFMNRIFSGLVPGIDFKIDSRCHSTIEDYLYIKETADGTKLKEKMKNESGVAYEKYGHRSDAGDYFFTECFREEFRQLKDGSRDIEIKIQPRDLKKSRF